MIKTTFTIICIIICCNLFAQDIFITKDTVINTDWKIPAGTILKFGSKGHISGKGSIKGGIIDAALTQFIFDTTLYIYPEGTYGDCFSAKWFGAGKYTDNYNALQKGINTVVENNQSLKNFFIPKGVYEYSKPLKIQQLYKGKYVGCNIHLYGESSFWDCCNSTTLVYKGYEDFALGLQVNKGTEINNLIIKGQFKSPEVADSLYYNIPFEKYNDVNGKCSYLYAGIAIDYDGTLNTSGSTGVKIHDVFVGNFSVDYLVSPNGSTFNAEILLFENIRCGDARVGFANGQAQEKGNVIRGIYSWGRIHTLFTSGKYGKTQARHYTIDGGNVAGYCIRLFDISQAGWYSTNISNVFAESIGTVGTIYSQIPTSISNCTFHFVFPQKIGRQTLFTGNNNNIQFNSCIFRYYGSKQAMKFAGLSTFNNCYFSGEKTNK